MAMRIVVFGTGGVGGYFGGRLAQAGHDVTFIARGEHLKAMREHGLRVESVHGDFTLEPVQATDDAASVGPVDYVLVAVKHYQLRPALPAIASLVGDTTTVAPLLNGVEAPAILGEVIDPARIIGGLCAVFSAVKAPGVIAQTSEVRRVVLGELNGEPSARVKAIVGGLQAAGTDAVLSEEIEADMWDKLILISSMSGIGALSRSGVGRMLEVAESRQLYIEALAEAAMVGRASGVNIAEDVVERRLAFAEGLEYDAITSMHRDVEAGKPFELEAFSGTIVRRAAEAGVEAPIHATIYALLSPALRRAMGGD
jgi:2-dehydropantoate 2-reductase